MSLIGRLVAYALLLQAGLAPTLVLSKEKVAIESSCFDLGKRYGRCAGLVMSGKKCPPVDDFAVPDRCKGHSDTKNGIAAGLRQVFPDGHVPIK